MMTKDTTPKIELLGLDETVHIPLSSRDSKARTLERVETASTLNSDDTSSSSDSSTTSSSTRQRSVMFSSVSVREYNRVVGDHPDTRFGPPLALGWEYSEKSLQDVDDYENNRVAVAGPYRLSALARKNILNKEFGIPAKEIAASEKEVQRILKQRKQTNAQSKGSQKRQGFMQSAKRKIKRTFSSETLLESMSRMSMLSVPVQS